MRHCVTQITLLDANEPLIMTDDFWNGLGIDVVKLLAGFAGGTVAALTVSRNEPWQLLIRVIVGGLTANYLGAPAETYVSEHIYDLGHGTSFLLGVIGMIVCQGVLTWAKLRSKRYADNGRETQK